MITNSNECTAVGGGAVQGVVVEDNNVIVFLLVSEMLGQFLRMARFSARRDSAQHH
jgi:hypothetical protein